MSKYSDNLGKFTRSPRNKVYNRVFLHTHDDAGQPVTQWDMQHIILGFRDEKDVCGAYLNRILCSNPQTWCFVGLATQVADITDEFWLAYQRDGRCVIDRNHTGWFANDADRFSIIGNTRRCNWCGEWHGRTLEKRTKITRREVWVPQQSIATEAA